MGYDLHITRAADWTDAEVVPIRSEEWLALVEVDPELRLAGYNGSYFALWTGKSKHPDPWFDWSGGQVHTKNPDPPLIEKAIQIAEHFGASVVGDDGERYLPGGRGERNGSVDSSPEMDWRQW
jgi:hypothetical protein